MIVPHRDEFTETVGYYIKSSKKSVLFIPDIDAFSQWSLNIKEEISKVDFAFIDATFYDGKELPGRDLTKIPHPFVSDTIQLLADLKDSDKQKVFFIHINHSNPLLQNSAEK